MNSPEALPNKKSRITIRSNMGLHEIFLTLASETNPTIEVEIEEGGRLGNYMVLKLVLFRFPGRKFVFRSNDMVVRKIVESLGMRCYQKTDNVEFEHEFSKTHMLRYNYTFWEYLVYEVKRWLSKVGFFLSRRAKTYKNKKRNYTSHSFLLVAGLAVSLSLLVFIFYFAVSRTYVYVTPEVNIKTISRNFIFTENGFTGSIGLDTNRIEVRPTTYQTSLQYTFNVSSIDQASSKNSRGNIWIFNEMKQEQVFRPNTRFVTDDGLVFRSVDWIKVPPTKVMSGVTMVGKTESFLQADLYDASGSVMGERWNIPEGTTLTIPGLKFNRDRVYAKAKGDFVGGANPNIHVLTQEELDKFKSILTEKLKMQALQEITRQIERKNRENNEDFQVMPVPDSIVYNVPTLQTESGATIGSKREEVTLYGAASVSLNTYDRKSLLFSLKNLLNDTLLYGTEKLIGVNEESLRITTILSRTPAPSFSMKATTELEASISYNFEDPTNNLSLKLKNLIVNATEKEATSILLNDSNIASVKLRFSPFWMTRVANNPDNIEFVIEK